MADLGLTHIALTVRDTEATAAFYATYASMEVVHRRRSDDNTGDVLWLSDRTRPFVIVVLPRSGAAAALVGFNHLGVGVASRDEVDRLVALARAEGRIVHGPFDYGPPVGYWGFIEDPDGNNLEVSFGQDVGLAVAQGDGEPSE